MLMFLVVINAFAPLTTDLYLPALPQMVDAFNTSQSMVNMTLSVYFATYALGLLFWGPLSEKFGRKPILLIGIGGYILGSLSCAAASSVELLIFARIFQAFGGSGVTVVATAIVKDHYDGAERQKIMATIMSLVIIAPMVAPVLGALLLKFTSWRMMFVVLAIWGSLAALLTTSYRETLKTPYTGSTLRSWGRLIVVLKNPRFTSLLGIFPVTAMALMAFLAASSYIYIDTFGLTEEQYSYAFSFNAIFASFGPRIYLKLSDRISTEKVITLCFAMLTVCGLLTYTLGHMSPWLFALLAAPATLAIITTRVPGTNLMLEQQDSDTGSAVAIIQFCSMMCGSISMQLVSLRPESLIKNLGTIQFVVGATAGVLWILVKNRPHVAHKLSQFTH